MTAIATLLKASIERQQMLKTIKAHEETIDALYRRIAELEARVRLLELMPEELPW